MPDPDSIINPIKASLRWLVSATVLLCIVIGGLTIAGYFYSREVSEFSEELRMGLIESCEQNGNPLRETVQSILHEQIKTARNPELLLTLFPNLAPSQLQQLIQTQIEADRLRLKQIAPLDCQALYPMK